MLVYNLYSVSHNKCNKSLDFASNHGNLPSIAESRRAALGLALSPTSLTEAASQNIMTENLAKENAMQLRVDFSLEYRVRHDKDAKVFVAYVPMLRLFTQAKTKRRLGEICTGLSCQFC